MADLEAELEEAHVDVTIAAALLDVVYMEIESNADYTRQCADHVPEIRRKNVYAMTHAEVIVLDHAVTQVAAAAKRLSCVMQQSRIAALKKEVGHG